MTSKRQQEQQQHENNEMICNINNYNRTSIRNIPWIWKIIHKYRAAIIFFWLCIVFPIGRHYRPKFIESTDSTLEPIPGSESYEANQVYQQNYLPPSNSKHMNQPLLIYLQVRDDNEVGNNNSSSSMTDTNSELYIETKRFIEGYTSYLINLADPGYVTVNHYYTLEDMGLYTLATKSLIRNDGTDMILQVTTLIEHAYLGEFIHDLQKYGNENVPNDLSISYTGLNIFQQDMINQTKEDTRMMDVVALPTALCVLCIVLHWNVPLVLIPIVMIVTTMNTWSIIMYPIAKYYMQVTQVTPSIMSSLSVAMGIDYSLFILSRAQEELFSSTASTTTPHEAVIIALINAGYSILVSGCTIMLCLFGLTLLPLESFVSLGLGSGIAVFSCLLVNLTLVPAILFTKFGKSLLLFQWKDYYHFSNTCAVGLNEDEEVVEELLLTEPLLSNTSSTTGLPTAPPLECFRRNNDPSYIDDQTIITTTTSSAINKLSSITNIDETNHTTTSTTTAIHENKEQQQVTIKNQSSSNNNSEQPQTQGLWFKFGNQFIHYPRNIIIFLFITMLIVPFAINVPMLKTSISNQLLLPTNSPALQAYKELSLTFGEGYLNPYKIIFDGSNRNNQNISSQDGFQVMHLVYQQLLNKADHSSCNDSYSGISALAHRLIDYDIYVQAMECGIYCSNEPLATIAYVNSINTANQHVSYLTIVLALDPYSVDGTEWLTSARNILSQLKEDGELLGFDVYIQAGAGVVYDAMIHTFQSFPLMIGVTSLVVLLLMGISFKSVVTPIRSLLSISYTLLFSYGLFVLVYQKGCLDWMGIRSLSAYRLNDDEEGQISFIPPIMAFTVIVGLSLDYDVFLITRVYEYRIEQRYFHKSSILLGLQGTGRIITAAGIIMSIAFGGLLASSSLLLNQYAFLLMSSVLLDTFVIRTILVPTLLTFSGSFYSWWPNRNVPMEEFSVLPPGTEN